MIFYGNIIILLKFNKMKKRKKIELVKELDLHGFTVIEAENLLYDFLSDFRESNFKEAQIITGYGLNSPGGKSVIKELTNKVLIEKGFKFKYLEGSGVFKIVL